MDLNKKKVIHPNERDYRFLLRKRGFEVWASEKIALRKFKDQVLKNEIVVTEASEIFLAGKLLTIAGAYSIKVTYFILARL